MNIPTTVTYIFEGDSKQVSAIGEKALLNEKGRLKSEAEMHHMFATTAHDLGAISYEL